MWQERCIVSTYFHNAVVNTVSVFEYSEYTGMRGPGAIQTLPHRIRPMEFLNLYGYVPYA